MWGLIRFILERLGGATIGDYEKLQAEKLDLENKYAELLKAHEATCKEVTLEKKNSTLFFSYYNISNICIMRCRYIRHLYLLSFILVLVFIYGKAMTVGSSDPMVERERVNS